MAVAVLTLFKSTDYKYPNQSLWRRSKNAVQRRVPLALIDMVPRKVDMAPRNVDMAPRNVDIAPRKVDMGPRKVGDFGSGADYLWKHEEMGQRESDTLTSAYPIQAGHGIRREG